MAAKSRCVGPVCARYVAHPQRKDRTLLDWSLSRLLNDQHLARILGIVNNDLLTVFNKVRLLLDTQLTELNAKIESDKSTLAHRYVVEFMNPLVKKVSEHALDKLLEQYNYIDMDDGDECTGLFRASFGVPFRHEIKRRIEENGRFHIRDINRQWYLVAPPVVQTVDVAAEPRSSPRKSLMRTLEKR
ncbi:hypothetical protein PsorP6_009462 [Peronosclerospora sorghi]|uniref:Uncharacterized protein n=1 Tax=Peronosclerospora sorghi TaxID=230839 RepID=A0ACC0W1P5_9STRA|nr:hypothetical protein PsorP6_009462 [Peronosclerospora sorghi]